MRFSKHPLLSRNLPGPLNWWVVTRLLCVTLVRKKRRTTFDLTQSIRCVPVPFARNVSFRKTVCCRPVKVRVRHGFKGEKSREMIAFCANCISCSRIMASVYHSTQPNAYFLLQFLLGRIRKVLLFVIDLKIL